MHIQLEWRYQFTSGTEISVRHVSTSRGDRSSHSVAVSALHWVQNREKDRVIVAP